MKKIINLIFIACILFSFTACKGSNKELVIGIAPDMDSVPLVMAMQKGYLPSNVTLKLYQSSVERDEALTNGLLDGAFSDVFTACFVDEIYIVSQTTSRCGFVANNTFLQTVADLEGKRVALNINTTTDYVADSILIKNGVDISTIEKVAVPSVQSGLALLEANQVDAVFVYEPHLTSAKSQGSKLLTGIEEFDIVTGVVLFTDLALTQKTHEIEALRNAYDKAVDYINNSDETDFFEDWNNIVEYLGFPDSSIYMNMPYYKSWKLPEESEISRVVKWLEDKEIAYSNRKYSDLLRE